MENHLQAQDDGCRRQHNAVGDDALLDVDRGENDEDAAEKRADKGLTTEAEAQEAKRRDEADARGDPGPVAG
jgi:hypothetical protein